MNLLEYRYYGWQGLLGDLKVYIKMKFEIVTKVSITVCRDTHAEEHRHHLEETYVL